MLQEGVEMSIDMEEILLDLDETAKKKSNSVSVLPENTLSINNDNASFVEVNEDLISDNLKNNQSNQINEIENFNLNDNFCDNKNVLNTIDNNDFIDNNEVYTPVKDIFEDALSFVDNLDENITDNNLISKK